MIPTNHTFHQYEGSVSGWLGWLEDERGVCVGFVDDKNKIVGFDAITGELTPA